MGEKLVRVENHLVTPDRSLVSAGISAGMETRQRRAVCLISGGLDSTVAASVALHQGYELDFLFANYGQKTFDRERISVDAIADRMQPQTVYTADLTFLKDFGVQANSALFNPDVTLDASNTTLEYVPFRNSVLLATATAMAESRGADAIFVGSTGGDRICPDNSQEFLDAFGNVMQVGTMIKKDIVIEAPLINTDKKGAVELGLSLETPFELTWSCHNNVEAACGGCSNCRARVAAFTELGQIDPIPYQGNMFPGKN